jgi:flagellar biosynthesis protein FlhB
MAEQGDLDRSEPATAFRLEKAHQRGSIARSGDLTFAGVLFACVACIHGLGLSAVQDVAGLLGRGLQFAGRDTLTGSSALAYVRVLAVEAATVMAPILAVLWLSALLIAALQARGVFTTQPLQPDFTRLNPAKGLARIFSIKSVHELWRSAAKLSLICLAMAAWGRHHLGELLRMQTTQPRLMTHEAVSLLASVMTLLAGLVLALALLDWGFNRWEFMRQMRMSKREVKDENKEREGDPRIKARLRDLRLDWLKRSRQLSKVRNADLLLTNPTHYAVALEYRHGEMPAPVITARGAGELAQRMRAEAHRGNVPVVQHPQLARALYALHESQVYVPHEHFDAVARVLRWVFAARGARRTQGGRS